MCILCFFPPPPPPTIQSLAELSTLQGLEDDHTFQKEVSLKTLVYKAYRSVFLWLVFQHFQRMQLKFKLQIHLRPHSGKNSRLYPDVKSISKLCSISDFHESFCSS